MTARDVVRSLKHHADADKARASVRFFKTGPSQYGEGDTFLGITVPEQRKVARRFGDLPLSEIRKLIADRRHEVRLTGLLILTYQMERGDEVAQRRIFDFYLTHTQKINNWDLVDSTAGYIVGRYIFDSKGDRRILYRLARSTNLWERRIAIVATSYFIGKNDFEDTIALAGMLLSDEHDLIHKATGWMLREVGKRNEQVLRAFLELHASRMPRTMLRYALEKFPETIRRRYMKMPRV